ncbi:MAG: hypothetical protein JSW39_10555 [Desulfobacterales bacterium]|nr:MAG: hypothetical protein JSW39_10555 [Desulfobacterales bacterium]
MTKLRPTKFPATGTGDPPKPLAKIRPVVYNVFEQLQAELRFFEFDDADVGDDDYPDELDEDFE